MLEYVRAVTRAGGVFAVLLAFALAACGGDEGTPDSGQTVDAGNDTEDATGDADVTPDATPDASGDTGADTTPDVPTDTVEEPDATPDADAEPDAVPDLVDEPDADTGIDPTILRIPPLERNPIVLEASVRIAEPIELPAALGGSAPYTYRTSALPAGVVFDAPTRTLAGRPLTAGARAVTYTVRDAEGEEASRSLVINVLADTSAPEAPTAVTFVDDETDPSVVRAPDFGFSWTRSASPDVASVTVYLLPEGELGDTLDPVAEVDGDAASVTLEAAVDSTGGCLRASTPYRAVFVMEDESGNTTPLDPTSLGAEDEGYYLDFTSAAGDGVNALSDFYFDEDPFGEGGSDWEATAEGPSSSVETQFDDVNDASSCPASGSLRVSNTSDGDDTVPDASVAVVGQCVRVNASREYGYSADILVPSEQERAGYGVLSVTWYRSSDCSGAPTGTDALDTVEDSEGEWVFLARRLVPPTTANSAAVELRTLKQAVTGDDDPDEPFVAWYDNVFFGVID
jgi:hypothetical protein